MVIADFKLPIHMDFVIVLNWLEMIMITIWLKLVLSMKEQILVLSIMGADAMPKFQLLLQVRNILKQLLLDVLTTQILRRFLNTKIK